MSSATLSQSFAILKRKYAEGRLPKEQFSTFPLAATLKKKEDWDGDDYAIALQTENPQGSSAIFSEALASLQQGNYVRFLPTRREHYGVARIRDHALKAAAKNSGALVNLWDNETDGISATEMKCVEIYAFGNGSGVLGQVSGATTGVTIQLLVPEDAAKFDLGMRLQGVSDATLSPTVFTGSAKVTGIDRKAGTITAATAWSSNITGLVSGSYLVRAGDAANTVTAGGPTVIWGMGTYIVGGTTPGTVDGLNRNQDPVRLGGQLLDASGLNMAEAIIDAESLVTAQGRKTPTRLWVHNRDLAQMRKTADGKAVYPKTNMDSTIAGVSFKAIEFEGDTDTIKIMTSPFIQRGQAFLVNPDSFTLASLGPMPQLDNFDSNSFLRVADDAAEEVRFASFGNLVCNSPVDSIQLINFGK